ncbi:paired box pox-neuro [Paramuricea clavata]|uniref:Paired box pox-neuro n=1 Tax=Paramuricea clavata TaxID=317549 RepID=A0A6S7IK58_PARCT|nr:paired box pox-neuro [Paramuricea clavata]
MSNSYTTQGKALPDKVRQEIIEKLLNNEGIAEISRQLVLPYKSVSNIVDLWPWITTGSTKPRSPQRVGIRTARTDDVIRYTEYTKINKPSTYAKEIRQQLKKENVCLPENVPSNSCISGILKSDLGYLYKKLSVYTS